MSTQYTLRATIPVPPDHIGDANQFALCVGESPHDDKTFGVLSCQDELGNLYSVVSAVVKPEFVRLSSNPLAPPAYAPHADIEAAERARALVVINGGPARPDRVMVALGDRLDAVIDHLDQLGLTLAPIDLPG